MLLARLWRPPLHLRGRLVPARLPRALLALLPRLVLAGAQRPPWRPLKGLCQLVQMPGRVQHRRQVRLDLGPVLHTEGMSVCMYMCMWVWEWVCGWLCISGEK